MPEENIIPSQQPRSAVTFSVSLNGELLPASFPVISIQVQKEINRITAATLMLQDGMAAAASFAGSNGNLFIPGNEVEIKAGYRSNEDVIFKGIIIKHSIKVRANISILVVECRHKAIEMTTHLHNQYFHNMNDAEVSAQLCNHYNIALTNEGSYLQHKELVQFYCSDWDFMICRAEANGAWVTTNDNGEIAMAPPNTSQEAVLAARFGATLKNLDAEIDSRLQFEEWSASGWNANDQALLENVTATNTAGTTGGNLSAATLAQATANATLELWHTGLSEVELKKWADAALQKNRLARLRGRATIDGSAMAQPGKILELSGTSDRFNGKVMISGVRHMIEKNQWETTIQFGDNPNWHATTFQVHQPLAGALLPPIQGLHIGIVTDLEDPESAERIKVRLPMVSSTDDGAWMRMATMDAGNNRGWLCRPELDDEVIVSFLNNDPRFGIILGKMHSSKNAAPIPASNNNHVKGYTSRSEMKFHFDDEKKTISLSTPAGNMLLMDEENNSITLKDQHGNKIEMNEDGISMSSIKKIIINASNDLEAEAGTNATISAGTQLKAKGSAGAELSSSGNTVIKGAIVQIN